MGAAAPQKIYWDGEYTDYIDMALTYVWDIPTEEAAAAAVKVMEGGGTAALACGPGSW